MHQTRNTRRKKPARKARRFVVSLVVSFWTSNSDMEVGRKGKTDPDASRKKTSVSRDDSMRWRIDVEDYESDTGEDVRREVRRLIYVLAFSLIRRQA